MSNNNNNDFFINESDDYSVLVSSDKMKFTAAHFIAFDGYRERLHGHNYTVEVMINGSRQHDGYVIDFGDIKKLITKICKEMNEHFILPMSSNVLKINERKNDLILKCQDNTEFKFPINDVLKLPIVHSSAEELAWYVTNRFIKEFTVEKLLQREIKLIELSVGMYIYYFIIIFIKYIFNYIYI